MEIKPVPPEDDFSSEIAKVEEQWGIALIVNGKRRLWYDLGENPQVWDYDAERFLTPTEAVYRLQQLGFEVPPDFAEST